MRSRTELIVSQRKVKLFLSNLQNGTYQVKKRPLINTKSSNCTTVTSTCHQVITTSRPITSSNITPKSLPAIVSHSKKVNKFQATNLIRTVSTPSLNKIVPSDKTKFHRSFSKIELKGKSNPKDANRKMRKTEFIYICGSKKSSSNSTVNTGEV